MIILIMAGGLGKRMGSDIPKVCHKVVSLDCQYKSKPMIVQVILTALKLNPQKIFVIVGKFRELIENTIKEYLEVEQFQLLDWVIQEEALGTGHAILCSLPQISQFPNTNTLILSGDVPLISERTLSNLNGNTNKLLITELDEPTGCGRILLDYNKNIIKIIEQKDCNNEQKEIKLVNCGIYQINSNDLINLVPKITNNNKANEYYLTDIIELMINHNIPISYYKLPVCFQYETKNVNTQKDLSELNEFVLDMR